jgi:UDP-glucose 4-epimerase
VKALVTGAAGFIGSHLAERLISQGAQVVGVDAFTDYYPRSDKERNLSALVKMDDFTMVEASLTTVDLVPLLKNVTHVFHLAAQPGVRQSWGQAFHRYNANNVDATQRLLEACTGQPIERFVYASSSSVYGNSTSLPMSEQAVPMPVSPYGVTKLAAEHLCSLYCLVKNVPTVIVRYFTVYGPRQRPDMAFRRFFESATSGAALSIYGDGQQTRDFTYVDDAVSATLAAAQRGSPGSVYNVGGGERIALREVVNMIERIIGRPLVLDRQGARNGDMPDTFADTKLAMRELGFVPTVSLEEGLRIEYEWLLRTALPPTA